MTTVHYPERGFKFDNYQRNLSLTQNGFKEPKPTSTGTTIVGVKFKNGVILGADTRATAGPIVADKNCEKIHYIAPNIWCAGAGTAADTEFTTSLTSSNIELHALSTGRTPRVITVVTQLKQYLFRYQGYIGAYLIVAGVDPAGVHLFGCQAHGSTDKLPYMTLGSGSLAAMGVLECGFKVGMEKEEAMELVCKAVLGGVWNDLGSGGSVDLVVIEKDKPTQVLRPYNSPNPPPIKQQSYRFEIGTTKVLKESVIRKYAGEGKRVEVVSEQVAADAMQLD